MIGGRSLGGDSCGHCTRPLTIVMSTQGEGSKYISKSNGDYKLF